MVRTFRSQNQAKNKGSRKHVHPCTSPNDRQQNESGPNIEAAATNGRPRAHSKVSIREAPSQTVADSPVQGFHLAPTYDGR